MSAALEHNRSSCGKHSILLLGSCSLTGQVIIFRELYILFSGNELVLGIILSSWLFWIPLGSAVLGRMREPGRGRTLEGGIFLLAFLIVLTVAALRILSATIAGAPGELVPYWKMVVASLTAVAPCALIAGYLYSFASKQIYQFRAEGFLSGGVVYTWEAWGSGLAGLFFGLFLLGALGTFLSAMILLAVSASVLLWRVGGGDRRIALALSLVPVISYALLFPVQGKVDRSLESLRLRGFVLDDFADSPYGRIDAVRREEQRSIFINNIRVATIPDRAAAEEKLHFALLSHKTPRSLLFLGGALGDIAEEVSKYPLDEVDYVELDRKLLDIAGELGFLERPGGLRIVRDDARSFLQERERSYDVIVLAVGEPLSLQLNRFYTVEFFRLARKRLSPEGVFAVSLPGSDNFFSETQEKFLGCIFTTMSSVFPKVLFLPGETCHFIALNEGGSAVGPEEIIERLEEKNLRLRYLTPTALRFRFSPSRMDMGKNVVSPHSVDENRDFTFSGYIYDLLHWNSRVGAPVFPELIALVGKRKEIFVGTLFLSTLVSMLFFYLPRLRKKQKFVLLSVLVTGLSGMAGSITILVAFQILWGAIYQWIALLSGSFMIGAGLGSYVGTKTSGRLPVSLSPRIHHKPVSPSGGPHREPWRPSAPGVIVWQHAGISFLFLILLIMLGNPAGLGRSGGLFKVLFLFLNGFLGAVVGYEFVIACRAMGEGKEVPPLLYAFDLAGAFFGASIIASLFLPSAGLLWTTRLLLSLNAFVALFLAANLGAIYRS